MGRVPSHLPYTETGLIFCSVLEQADPDIILTSSKADDTFMDILRDQSKFDRVSISFERIY